MSEQKPSCTKARMEKWPSDIVHLKNSRSLENHRILCQKNKFSSEIRPSMSLSPNLSTQLQAFSGAEENTQTENQNEDDLLELATSKTDLLKDRIKEKRGNLKKENPYCNDSYDNDGFVVEQNDILEESNNETAVQPEPPETVVSVELNPYNPVHFTSYLSLLIIPIRKNRNLSNQ